jgi:phage major head subunit gpT-like protein
MSVITTGNHPKELWPGVAAWFGRQYDEYESQYTKLFDTETSEKNYEEDVQVTGFGLASIKTEGASITYDTETQGFTKRYTHVVYGSGYIVTREELEDSQYEVVSKRRAQAMAFSARQTKENVTANVYNRGFNTAYTGGDGKRLLTTDHPSIAGDWSNVLATAADLSESSLEDMIIQIMGATNDRGLRISLQPKSLIVHRNDWFNANRILKSTLQNDTSNNSINALKATNALPGGIVVNQYLTDSDAWFIRTNAPRGMIYWQRRAYEFKQDNDFDTENAKAKFTERYAVGWTDPRGLYGSAGA